MAKGKLSDRLDDLDVAVDAAKDTYAAWQDAEAAAAAAQDTYTKAKEAVRALQAELTERIGSVLPAPMPMNLRVRQTS